MRRPAEGETLAGKGVIPILLAALLLGGCGEPPWPDSRGAMTEIFDQKRDIFLELEREMAADGLLRMSPGVFSEMARNPAIPALPSDQAAKYLDLFARTAIFVSVIRRDGSTEFEMMIENVGPRLYLSRFVHARDFRELPTCAIAMSEMACGTCIIELEDQWQLEYSWFPANVEEEARRC